MNGSSSEPQAFFPEERQPIAREPEPLGPRLASAARGLGLAGIAAGLFSLAWLGVTKLSWLMAPLSGLLAIGGVLATWAALIHITGGEKFDDHPFV